MNELRDVGIRHHRRYIFNCYVVEDGGEGAPLVVDPGIPTTMRAAKQTLAELGASTVTVAATHAHSDHVAGMPELRDSLGAKLFIPARARHYLRGEKPRTPSPRDVAHILPVLLEEPLDWAAVGESLTSAPAAGYGILPYRFPGEVGYLEHGDRVPGAPEWEVLHTPGHTDCASCLWNARTRTLMSGDTILSFEGRAWFNPEFVDGALSDATERVLRELPVEHLLPGHGHPVSGPDVMGEALSHRERPHGWSIWSCRARRRVRA